MCFHIALKCQEQKIMVIFCTCYWWLEGQLLSIMGWWRTNNGGIHTCPNLQAVGLVWQPSLTWQPFWDGNHHLLSMFRFILQRLCFYLFDLDADWFQWTLCFTGIIGGSFATVKVSNKQALLNFCLAHVTWVRTL